MKIEIVLTDFAKKRHFDPAQTGTVITDWTPEDFVQSVNNIVNANDSHPLANFGTLKNGYAPFCKLLYIINQTNAKTGTIPITPENEDFLKCGYLARTEGELPVLTRWFESKLEDIPKAIFLCVILYDKKQLHKEGTEIGNAHYGIVAILGQMLAIEEPMTPITIMRNALGIEEGGSGYPLNKEMYLKSVHFWNKNAIIKTIT